MDARKNLQLAVTEGLLEDINNILTESPWLINPKKLGEMLFYDAVVAGKFVVVDYLLNHKAYQALKIQEKSELLRDIVDAGLKLAQDFYQRGETEKTIEMLEKTFFYNKKIIDKNDEDYTVFAYGLNLLASVYMKEKQETKASQALQEAIFIQKKVREKTDLNYRRLVSCLNALAKYQLKEQELDEAIKSLGEAFYYCEKISSENEIKDSWLAILAGNLNILYRNSLAFEAGIWGFESKSLTRNVNDSLVYSIINQLYLQDFLLNSNLTLAYFQELPARHREQYAAFYSGDLGNKDLHTYLTRLTQTGIWKMDQALKVLAFSRALNVNLVIIRGDAEAPIILKQAQALTTLYLGMETGQVYQSLRMLPGRSPLRALQESIDEAVVDDFHKLASNFLQAPKALPMHKRSHEVMTPTSRESENKRLKLKKERRGKRGCSALFDGYSSENDSSKHLKLFSAGKPFLVRSQSEFSSEASLNQNSAIMLSPKR